MVSYEIGRASEAIRGAIADKALAVADERGRVYVIDLDNGRLLRNLRL